MTTQSLALQNAIHTGRCPAVMRPVLKAAGKIKRALIGDEGGQTRDYCLNDLEGQRLGLIPSALERPSVGSSQPTVYLQRR